MAITPGANSASPTATTSSTANAAASKSTSMLERFNELEQGAGDDSPNPADDNDDDVVDGEPQQRQQAGKPDAQGQQKKGAVEKGKTVPVETMQKRINQVTAARRAAETKTADAELRATKAEKAVELIGAENERLRALLAKANVFDAKDEEIAQLQLTNKAKAEAQAADAAHKKRLEEATKSQGKEAQAADLQAELEEVSAAHPNLHPQVLIDAAKKNAIAHAEGRAPLKSFEDLALEEEAKLEKHFRGKFGLVDDGNNDGGDADDGQVEQPEPAPAPQRRQLPTNIKHRPGGGARKQHPPTKDGMLARFNELQSLRRE